MFRKLLFTISLFAFVGMVSAQTLQFEHDGVILEEGHTIVCAWDDDFEEFIGEVGIRNISNESQDVLIEKEVIQAVDGGYNYFCWGLCYSQTTTVSNMMTITAQSLCDDALSIHFGFDEGSVGTMIVKFSAYTRNNPAERVNIYAQASPTVGVAENRISFGGAYPNPATTQVCFNYKSSSSTNVNVVVYNLLGQEVKSQLVNGEQGVIRIAVDDLQPGIYFCNFQVNNAVVKTEKFIVKR